MTKFYFYYIYIYTYNSGKHETVHQYQDILFHWLNQYSLRYEIDSLDCSAFTIHGRKKIQYTVVLFSLSKQYQTLILQNKQFFYSAHKIYNGLQVGQNGLSLRKNPIKNHSTFILGRAGHNLDQIQLGFTKPNTI